MKGMWVFNPDSLEVKPMYMPNEPLGNYEQKREPENKSGQWLKTEEYCSALLVLDKAWETLGYLQSIQLPVFI